MIRAALALFLLAAPAAADTVVRDVVESHILPGFTRLELASAALDDAAEADCAAEAPALRAAYQSAFDAWMGVSHLRFGPTETAMRAFGLAFWPDQKGATPKALRGLLAGDLPLDDPAVFAAQSIAARGLFALDMLLYDEAFLHAEPEARRCALVRAVAADIAATAAAIAQDWRDDHAARMLAAGADDLYRTPEDARRALLTALAAGLEFTASARLGLPMGTFERPRPRTAEAWRSGRPLRNVQLALDAARNFAVLLSAAEPEGAAGMDDAFSRAEALADALDDPLLAGVAEPAGRLKVEALKQAVEAARAAALMALGPALGVAAGFNSMDGD